MRHRPIVVAPRRRTGLLGTVARTAVIAGTATAVSRGMSNAMNASTQQRAQFQEYQSQQEAALRQAQIDDAVQQHLAAQQATPLPAPAAPPVNDMLAQLQQLAQMKQAGLLTDEEFIAAKAKLLGG